MALELQTDILEKPQTVVGTGGFDLRQILAGQQVNNFVPVQESLEDQIASKGGVTALANASMFIDGVNVPQQIAERVQREANFANLQDKTGMTIGSGSGGGAIKIITSKDEDGNGIDDEEENGLKDMADAANNGQQNPMTEQEWDEGSHNIAGMQMSGAEIDNVIQFMRDPRSRQRLIQQRAAQLGGDTRRAEEEVNMTLAYLEAQKRIARGQGTDEDRAFVQSVDSDPARSATVRTVVGVTGDVRANLNNSVTRQSYEDLGMDVAVSGIGINRGNANIDAMNTVSRLEPITIAETIDPNASTLSSRAAFNQSANPNIATPQPASVLPAPTVVLASATSINAPALNQSAGMI